MLLLFLNSCNTTVSTIRWLWLLKTQDLFCLNPTSVFPTVTLLSWNWRVVLFLPKLSNGLEPIPLPRLASSFPTKTKLDFQTAESTLISLLLSILALSTLQNILRVFLSLKRIEVKTTYLFTPLITRKDFKETIIMDGIITTEICFATPPSSHTRVKVLTSMLSITSTSWDKIFSKEDQQETPRSNTGLLTRKSSSSLMPMRLLLRNAEREVLMYTSDGRCSQLDKTNMVKKLPLSDVLTQVRPLRRTSSLLSSTLPASLIKSFLILVLPTMKELLMLIHTLFNTKDLRTSLLSVIALVLTLPELKQLLFTKPPSLSITWSNS